MRPRPSSRLGLALFAAATLSTAGAVGGQEPPLVELNEASSAAEAARFLLLPIGARSVGLAGAVTSLRGEAEGVLWNPASTAAVERSAVFFHGSNDFGTDSQVLGIIGRWTGLRVGLAYYRVDLGKIEARDAENRELGTLSLADAAFIVSAAYPVLPWLDAGLTYKLLRLGTDCSGACDAFAQDATGHAFDVGAIIAPPTLPALSVGIAVRNLGPAVTYRSGGPSDALPTRLRAGVTLDVLEAVASSDGSEITLRVSGDLRQTVSEFDDLDGFLGLELGYHGLLFARAGYAWAGEGRRGPALGLGLRYDRLSIDVGRAFDDFAGFDSDAPFQFSLGVGL